MATAINNPEIIQERYTDYYGLDTDVTPEIPMKGLLGWTGSAWEKINSTGGAINISGPYIKLDQTTPQTLTGMADGALGLISGVFSIIGRNIDGGFANSVYLISQNLNGGGA